MWTTLGLLTFLSLIPGQAGDLKLTNVRTTYGDLGPPRADSRLLPGDSYFVAFDIENVKISEAGEVKYSMGMELTDSKKKVWYKQDPQQFRALYLLGGSTVPAFIHVDVGLDQPPGKYTLTVNVTDVAAKATKSLTRDFEVLPPAFGLVRLNLASVAQQARGAVAPMPFVGIAGQSLSVNFWAVGFGLNAKKAPDMTLEMRALDSSNKPTLPKPLVLKVNERDSVQPGSVVPLVVYLNLNRAGTFSVSLKATDNINKKTAELTFPIKVIELK